jgi:hypothetical protein
MLLNFNFKIRDRISKPSVLAAIIAKMYFQILVRKIIKEKKRKQIKKKKSKTKKFKIRDPLFTYNFN